MPPKAASTTTRKRKKAEDMAESPPKRVTRAKAAKTAAESTDGPKTTRITTASARIAAEAKKAATPKTAPTTSRSTKRKATADKEEPVEVNEGAMLADKPETTKTRGRPKKSKDVDEGNVPKTTTKTRQAKTKAADENAQEKPKARSGRSKAAKEEKVDEIDGSKQAVAEAAGTTKRTTRSRAGTVNSQPEQLPSGVAKKPRKKVTFEDDLLQDKENVPVTKDSKKKSTLKETGLKAKPVRRPAATRTANRAGKATTTVSSSRGTAQPLSPKKVTQIAKSSSSSSEDELGKSPVKPVNKTPVKATSQEQSNPQQAKDVDEPKSPVEVNESTHHSQSFMASPAKRPPPSPFKDILKGSPKKLPKFSPMKTLSDAPDVQIQFKDSMKRSPKRLGFTPLLSQSHSQNATTSQAPATNRAALLNSPARRPNSPLKVGSLKVLGKTGTTMPVTNTTSALRHMKSTSLFSATPRRLFGTPMKASKGLVSPTKVERTESPEAGTSQLEQGPLDQTLTQPIAEEDEHMDDAMSPAHTSPPRPQQFFVQDVFSDTPKQFRSMLDEDSEDELQSGTPTMKSPMKKVLLTAQGFTPAQKKVSASATSPKKGELSVAQPASTLAITPLAVQMSNWFAASPPKDEGAEGDEPSNVFTPVGAVLRRNSGNVSRRQTMTPQNPTFFEEQIEALDADASLKGDLECHDALLADEAEATQNDDIVSQSQESEQYGDENELPPVLSAKETAPQVYEVTEEKYVTPARVFDSRPKMVYTTSKVPLKGCQDDSPSALKVPKKRSKSLAGPLVELNFSEDSAMAGGLPQAETRDMEAGETVGSEAARPTSTPKVAGRLSRDARTPSLDLASIAGSPSKSVRKGTDAQILRGAVVHVDVHTTEGADASSIFVELLTSMGAKCIKQWSWNPRASMAAGEDPAASGKVGITHVVFKDGSKRTLQKIREAKGLVLCVGVGWVLE